MCLQFGFVIFWQKDFGAKAAHKMLVKLTPGRVSRSSSGDRRIPYLIKSLIVWIWKDDKRTDDYKIILNCVKN